jgi:hypothetical protein
MKKLIPILAILLLAGSTAAVTVPDSEGLQELKKEYNSQSDKVPGFVGDIVGGERVNFRVESGDENITVGVAFEGVNISELERGGLENPTLKAWTDNETVTAVMESEDKYSTLQEKLNENEINYEATTVGSSIKVVIFETLRGIADFLGLSF